MLWPEENLRVAAILREFATIDTTKPNAPTTRCSLTARGILFQVWSCFPRLIGKRVLFSINLAAAELEHYVPLYDRKWKFLFWRTLFFPVSFKQILGVEMLFICS